jgi:hypothetical protein
MHIIRAGSCSCQLAPTTATYHVFVLDLLPCWLVCLAHIQVRSIVGQIRPDRQTLLFSATMPKKVARLVTDVLTDPVTITVSE